MIRRIGMLVVLGLAVPAGVFAADWARFRGPQADGISAERGINKAWGKKPPRTAWKVAMSDQGHAGPAVAAGRVYIVDHQGTNDVVRALDLRTGKDVWRFSYPDPQPSNYGFARCTPTVTGGRVYTLSRFGLVHCLDAKTGKKIWSQDLVRAFRGKPPTWLYSASVLVDGNRVVVCPGGPGPAIVALDRSTGKVLWKGGGSDIAGYGMLAVATIGGKRQYVAFTGKSLIGVDPASGKTLWRFPWETRLDVNAAMPVVVGSSVFITSNYGRGCALVDVSGGRAKARWENREIHSHFNTAVYSGGYLYSTSDPGYLVCLDAKTGRVAWKQRGFEKGGLVAVDGTLIVVDGAKGDVVMVSLTPSSYKELGRTKPLQGPGCWAPPVVADGMLLVRDKQSLVCLSLK
ncbi:MAG: PQQ-binding-like beta-propeller repeat protein [Armatimonadetes bacterium]|nr:PQQ-binding-like beta-propeller repeat protein [Armatimonadota bacterium]